MPHTCNNRAGNQCLNDWIGCVMDQNDVDRSHGVKRNCVQNCGYWLCRNRVVTKAAIQNTPPSESMKVTELESCLRYTGRIMTGNKQDVVRRPTGIYLFTALQSNGIRSPASDIRQSILQRLQNSAKYSLLQTIPQQLSNSVFFITCLRPPPPPPPPPHQLNRSHKYYSHHSSVFILKQSITITVVQSSLLLLSSPAVYEQCWVNSCVRCWYERQGGGGGGGGKKQRESINVDIFLLNYSY